MKRVVHIFSREPGLKEIIASLCKDIELREIHPPSESQSLTPMQISELEKAEVLLSDPGSVGPVLAKLKNLKWLQSTWAGNDAMKVHLTGKPTFTMTRMADIFGHNISEYIIAQIIIHERHFHDYWQQQNDKIWQQRASTRSLQNLTIGILGAGNIGCQVAKVAKTIGMTTWGLVRRNLPPHERSPFIDHYRTENDLEELLSKSDYVCNILPKTAKTINLLSGNVLKACQKKKSVFINVGRGEIIDDNSLVNAVKNKWISGAVLDVFNNEPLPSDHIFWTIPEISITPHIAGPGIPSRIAEIFVRNLKLYNANEKLEYVFDWDEEY